MKKLIVFWTIFSIIIIPYVSFCTGSDLSAYQKSSETSVIEVTIEPPSDTGYLVVALKSGKVFADGKAHKEYIAFADRIVCDGRFTFKMNSAVSATGRYDLYLIDDSGKTFKTDFYYTVPSELETALENINAELSQKSIKEFVLQYEQTLNIDRFAPYLKVKERDELYSGIFNTLKYYSSQNVSQRITGEIMKSAVKQMSIVEAFNINDSNVTVGADNIILNADILGIDSLPMYSYYISALSADGLKNVNAYLSGQSYDRQQNFADDFQEYTYIQAIVNNKNFGCAHVNPLLILDAYNVSLSEYNLLSEQSKRKVDLELTEADIKTVEQLNSKIAELCKKYEYSGGGSSSGGGGGMSSSISATGSYAITEPVKNPLFCDISGFEWAENAIIDLYDKGIVSGVGNGQFEPSREITREEFVKMLIMVAKLDIQSIETEFSDLAPSHWAYSYIGAAVKNGIVSGYPDNSFGIGKSISREECAVMLSRIIGSDNAIENLKFADDEQISIWAKQAVYSLRNRGVLNGDIENHFMPKGSCTRAEAAVMIYNVQSLIDR